jgi:DNA methylase
MHLDRCQLDRSYSPAAFFSEALYFWAKVGSRKANKHINNSKPGDAVYESFAGSGTTIIAAEQTRRVFAAIEIDPAYVEVVTARWEAFHRVARDSRRQRRGKCKRGSKSQPPKICALTVKIRGRVSKLISAISVTAANTGLIHSTVPKILCTTS